MLNILIVENSSILTLDIKNRFQSLGYDVLAATTNRKDTLRILKQHYIDLIVIDTDRYENYDGLEILKAIKKRFRLHTIFISSISNEKSLQELLTLSPDLIINKPFTDNDFKINVRTTLNHLHKSKGNFFGIIRQSYLYKENKAFLVIGKNGKILFVNQAFKSLFNTQTDYFTGNFFKNFIITTYTKKLFKIYRDFIKDGRAFFNIKVKNKQNQSFYVHGELFYLINDGYIQAYAITLYKDIKRTTEKTGLQKHILDEMPIPVLVKNEEGVIIFANKALENITSTPVEAMLNKKVKNFPVLDKKTGILHDTPQGADCDHKQVIRIDDKANTLLKTSKKIKTGSTIRIIETFANISEYLDIDKKLQKSELKFRAIADNSTNAIIHVNSDAKVEYWNHAAEKMLGYSFDEALGKNIDGLIAHPRYKRKKMSESFKSFTKTGKGKFIGRTIEAEVLTKRGEILEVEVAFHGVLLQNQWNVMAVIKNISEKNKLLRELKKYNQYLDAIIDNTNVWISFFDDQHSLEIWNKACAEISGYKKSEFDSRDEVLEALVPDKTYRESLQKQVNNVSKDEDGHQLHVRITDKRNINKSISIFVQRLNDDNNQFKGSVWIGYDVSHETMNEKDMQARLEEKEALIKEIHHRVKNNLQVMNSLINLQAGYIEDESALEQFHETQNRIRSMAMIQETIYHSKDFSKINFTEYLTRFASDLLQFYNKSPKDILIQIPGKPLFMKIKPAVTFALLLNEILSNAIKYAFPGDNTGIIEVDYQLSKDNNYLEFYIGDNGQGFESDIDWADPDTLGLQLIQILSSQIDAEIQLHNKNGVGYTIYLPTKEIIST